MLGARRAFASDVPAATYSWTMGRYELIARALERAWRADTAVDPARWTAQCPSMGQCAVTSLVLHDYLGGYFHRGLVGAESHYWLELLDGTAVDLTKAQFGGAAVIETGLRTREYLLSDERTRHRYSLLKERVEMELARDERSGQTADLPVHIEH